MHVYIDHKILVERFAGRCKVGQWKGRIMVHVFIEHEVSGGWQVDAK